MGLAVNSHNNFFVVIADRPPSSPRNLPHPDDVHTRILFLQRLLRCVLSSDTHDSQAAGIAHGLIPLNGDRACASAKIVTAPMWKAAAACGSIKEYSSTPFPAMLPPPGFGYTYGSPPMMPGTSPPGAPTVSAEALSEEEMRTLDESKYISEEQREAIYDVLYGKFVLIWGVVKSLNSLCMCSLQ